MKVIKCPSCGAFSEETPEICNCGYNFKEAFKDMSSSEILSLTVSPTSTSEKQVAGSKIFPIDKTLIKVFLALVLVTLVSMFVLLRTVPLNKTSPILIAARTTGACLSATIQSKHYYYLTNGIDYTLSDVLADTQYSNGIIATTGEPEELQVSAVTPMTIKLKYKGKIFTWKYTSRNGNTPAHITEEIGDLW